MTNTKYQMTKEIQMTNTKTKMFCHWIFNIILSFALCHLSLLGFVICHSSAYAKEADQSLILSKQILEAKDCASVAVTLEELRGLYFKDNKYNEFVDFLNSLFKQKKELSCPAITYYIALTRFNQLKYLEETQAWDEYFNKGNSYRDQITSGVKEVGANTTCNDYIRIKSDLLLWKFYHWQQDTSMDQAIAELMNCAVEFSKAPSSEGLIKEVADSLLDEGEKVRSRELYKVYVDKITTSGLKDEELSKIAAGFYKEGNLDPAETVYDNYIDRIIKTLPKEKVLPLLIGLAKDFSYQEEGLSDTSYAEKIFARIQGVGGGEAFNEELLYLRAYNLEKSREFGRAKDVYIELINRYPKSIHYAEATYKIGIIFTYILGDIINGRLYFQKLGDVTLPWTATSFYQLGLLSQWEGDIEKAKAYYNKLGEKERGVFTETAALIQERLKEIEESKPLDYNIKAFLDVSLKTDKAFLEIAPANLNSKPYKLAQDTATQISSSAYPLESGCLAVELELLWSGDTGKTKPGHADKKFSTSYTQPGTKVITLLVVSPAGITEQGLDILDVY